MDPNRKAWNEGQKALRQALTRADENAIELFLVQHASVHSSEMASSPFSFADEVWQDLDEQALRRIPVVENHSVAWLFWHLARIEDVTMNLLLAGKPQLLLRDNWLDRLGVGVRHTGNGIDAPEVAHLSAAIDVEALWAYRSAVGRRTREIVRQIDPAEFEHNVDLGRVQRIWDEGAMRANASGIVDYWSSRTIAGLLLMPPTRHCFLHLSEARRIKKRRK